MAGIYCFGEFELDTDNRLLRRKHREIRLRPKTYRFLVYLIENRNRVITKEELFDALWEETIVTEGVLSHCIWEIRQALNESHTSPRYIRTVPRVGYKFDMPAGFEWREAESDELNKRSRDSMLWGQLLESRRLLNMPLAKLLLTILIVCFTLLYFLIETADKTVPVLSRVTSLAGAEYMPSFSPDGTQVVFSSAEPGTGRASLFVSLTRKQELNALTHSPGVDTSPEWSPLGDRIAFIRRVGDISKLMWVGPLGGEEGVLLEGFELGQGLSWSPDAEMIAFSSRVPGAESFAICLLRPQDGGFDLELTAPPVTTYGDQQPSFSQDGNRIALVRRVSWSSSQILVYSLLNGREHLLAEEERIYGLCWAENGDALIYSAERGGVPTLIEVEVESQHSQEIAPASAGMWPEVSSDGFWLVFSQVEVDQDIWRVDLGSKKEYVIVDSTCFDGDPEVSPDGKLVAFVSGRTGRTQVYKASMDGHDLMCLTDFSKGCVGSPFWSSDGRRIYFHACPSGSMDIFWVSPGGGPPTRLTLGPSDDLAPHCTQNGQFVYFGSNRSGTWQIWRASSSGGEPEQITREGGYRVIAVTSELSVYYTKRPGISESGIWKCLPEGGQEVLVIPGVPMTNEGFRLADSCDLGICFLEPVKGVLQTVSFRGDGRKTLYSFSRPVNQVRDLAASPEGDCFLFTVADAKADLMVLEGF